MMNVFDRKEVLKEIFSHRKVRRKTFSIAVDTPSASTVIGHIVRVGNVVLTLIPYANNKFVVCKNSL